MRSDDDTACRHPNPRKWKAPFMFLLGRIFGAIWRGPFFAGTTPDNPHVGWVLLKVLEVFWRIATLLTLSVGLVAAGVWIWERLNPPLATRMNATVSVDDPACKDNGPRSMRLRIYNKSRNTVGYTSIDFSAYISSISTDLVDYSDRYRTFEAIIDPYSGVEYCVTPPTLLSEHDEPILWVARVVYATKLDADRAAIPRPPAPIVVPPSTN